MLKHIIFWICFITAVVAMLQNVKRLISYLQLGQNENRFNNILTRVKNVLIIAIGQTKLLRDKVAGAVHAMIFWGFLVLLIAVIESIVEGLIPHGNLNWLGPIYSMITISQDVFCIAIIVGVIWAAIRRLSGNIKRLVVSPSEQRDAMLILTLIFVIVTSLFLTNASRLGANEEYSWAIRPISG